MNAPSCTLTNCCQEQLSAGLATYWISVSNLICSSFYTAVVPTCIGENENCKGKWKGQGQRQGRRLFRNTLSPSSLSMGLACTAALACLLGLCGSFQSGGPGGDCNGCSNVFECCSDQQSEVFGGSESWQRTVSQWQEQGQRQEQR